MEYQTANVGETQKLAGKILKEIAGRQRKGALVLALEGELGAGKTAFTQGLGEALGVKEKILSPTFVLMKRFALRDSRFANFYHLDAYRLSGAEDAKELGLGDISQDNNNLVVIEWAERIKDILPADAVWIRVEHGGEDRRRIRVET